MTDQTILSIRRPDDWHLHFRDGAAMRSVVPFTAKQFARAIVMPNLSPPVTTVEAGAAYRDRILAAVPEGVTFTPLMTAYLTDATDGNELARGHAEGVFTAAKLYPAHATTGSAHGVTSVANIMPALEHMARIGMPLLIHGEVTDSHVDIFDREAVFIERTLSKLVRDLPELKIVFEHITTADAVAFVDASGPNVGATITPQHLHINRNAMFAGGIRPHAYCLPVAKREVHRLALRKAATSGSSKYFLGTDSAPHPAQLKEHATGCAGCYTAHGAMELYAQAFDAAGALDKLEGFAGFYGADFYGLPRNQRQVSLVRETWTPPESLPFGDATIKPLAGGEPLAWRFKGFVA